MFKEAWKVSGIFQTRETVRKLGGGGGVVEVGGKGEKLSRGGGVVV